jgi:hypothetical protein
MKQTGYLHEYREADYLAGKLKAEVINPSGDWKPYAPKGEKQRFNFNFDAKSCTSFSATNTIEIVLNRLKEEGLLNEQQMQLLTELEIYKDGEFNISDRFSAVVGGTTFRGASFQQIWDGVRKIGIVAESIHPAGGETFEEYHDPSLITDEMKALAKRSLDIFIFAYSWARIDNIEHHLQQSPLQGAVPKTARHAITVLNKYERFDSYDPFIRPLGGLSYLLQPYIYLKTPKVQTVEDVKVKTVENKSFYKPKNFILEELVSKDIFNRYGERAWQFLDERMLMNIQAIRDHYGVSVTVNNWKWGGRFSFRGYDAFEFRKTYISQHHAGRAIDFDVKAKTAEQVRNDIVSGTIKLPHPNVWLEDNVNWVHMDVRYSNVRGAYQFNQ